MNDAEIVSLDGNTSRLPLSGNSLSLEKEQIPANSGRIESCMDYVEIIQKRKIRFIRDISTETCKNDNFSAGD